MKKFLFFIIISVVYSVGEASAVFLLINPGAGPAGTGEAFVAKADDAYATFYNPAGLGFQSGIGITGMHVNWLPNLADDLYYDFLALKLGIEGIGTLGANITFLNLGEQQATGDNQEDLGTFRSNMWAITGSYGAKISNSASIGLSFKVLQQNLAPFGAGSEESNGKSTNFAFDIGLLKKYGMAQSGFFKSSSFGLSIANIGPKVWFKDQAQADPLPTNMKIGLLTSIYQNKNNEINFLFDMNKLLVAVYPPMDWDGNGRIGGFDSSGLESENDDYNQNGQMESFYGDPWYKAVFTAWFDDWAGGGDLDYDGDTYIGNYTFEELDDVEGFSGIEQCVQTSDFEFGQDGYGIYDSSCEDKEVGSGSERTIAKEFKEMIYNFGIEYWYAKSFVVRLGYIFDQEGKITNPTFGAGVKLSGFGIDFGYTAGDQGHPRANTMFFSIGLEF